MNGQPWHFVVIRSPETKQQLVEIKNCYCPPEKREYTADFLQQAAAIIVVCVDTQRSFGREVENGVLASAMIMLGARSKGLGTVYMTAYRNDEPRLADEIRRILGLPDTLAPIAILPLGYAEEVAGPKTWRPLREMIHRERF